MAGLHAPLSTLRRTPHGMLRMTRGRCGSLHLHRNGLAPSTPCRSPGALRKILSLQVLPVWLRVVERDSQGGRLVWQCGARGGWCGVGWDGDNDVEHVAAEDKGLIDVAVTGEYALSVRRWEVYGVAGNGYKGLPDDVPSVGDAEDVVALRDKLEVEEAVVARDVGGGKLLIVVACDEGDRGGVDEVCIRTGSDAAGELVELGDGQDHVLTGEFLAGEEFDAGGLRLAGGAVAVEGQREEVVLWGELHNLTCGVGRVGVALAL